MDNTTDSKYTQLIIYAPGIHTGGGITLLKALVDSTPTAPCSVLLMLDARALEKLPVSRQTQTIAIQPSLYGRWRAERQLQRLARASDTLLCLHSLPPLLPSQARTLCFVQNILHLGGYPLNAYPLKTRLRLHAECLIGRIFKSRVDSYLVQTPSMASRLQQWHGAAPDIRISPFMPTPAQNKASEAPAQPLTDFLYVADGLPHKNHQHLIAAWLLLAEQAIYPRLTLTLTQRDGQLRDYIRKLTRQHGLNIDIRGALSHDEVLALYRGARALIYPSYAESLGLPLLEATQQSLPIIASERDYVRDVCRPAETFDPESPRSIARAVQRFLSLEEAPPTPLSPQAFFHILLERTNGGTDGAAC